MSICDIVKKGYNRSLDGNGQVSLSVDLINYAYALYKQFGFVDYDLHENSMTMLKRL